jgi:hypothetical protein
MTMCNPFTYAAIQIRQPIYRLFIRRSQAYGDLLQPLLEKLASSKR